MIFNMKGFDGCITVFSELHNAFANVFRSLCGREPSEPGVDMHNHVTVDHHGCGDVFFLDGSHSSLRLRLGRFLAESSTSCRTDGGAPMEQQRPNKRGLERESHTECG